VVVQDELTQGRGSVTRSNATTSQRAEAAKQKVTRQPAREKERQMGGRRQRLRIEKQHHKKNGATRGDTTISQLWVTKKENSKK
jgi:hypothetical protein